ncbi:MAG: hypothetical protein AcusKO_29480 [Acuticoccus sp.]
MAGRLKRSPFADLSPAQAKRAESVIVENPYGNGVDRVNMVDPIAAMRRQGRLTEREVTAANRYRSAFDVVHAGGCSPLALEPVDGGGGGCSISDRKLTAAGILSSASAMLGPLERPLWLLVSNGLTLEEVGRALGETNKRGATAAASTLVRLALRTLADGWEARGEVTGKRQGD